MRRQLRAWHLDQGGINSFRSHIEKPAQPFRQRNENALTDDVLSRQPPNLRSKTRLQGSRPARAGVIRRMDLRQLVEFPSCGPDKCRKQQIADFYREAWLGFGRERIIELQRTSFRHKRRVEYEGEAHRDLPVDLTHV